MTTTFLTATEIADILRISKALAYKLIAQGEIPSFQFGRVSRVRQEDLDTFIQKSVRKPNVAEAVEAEINSESSRKGDLQQDS